MSQSKRICHITTAHPRYDIRIFHKECLSLSEFYEVFLIVADGRGDEIKNGITIIDIGKFDSSRLKRIFSTTLRAYHKALSLKCELYHFHDPEFLFYGMRLIMIGKKVIYDVHEDVPKQTMSKDYIKPIFRKILAFFIGITERIISQRLTAIIVVTGSIYKRFNKWNKNTVIVSNFPFLLKTIQNYDDSREGICYVGNISSIRGLDYVLDSLEYTNTILHLAGEFETMVYMHKLQSHPMWHKVKYYGSLGQQGAIEIIRKSKAGLVTYLPVPNHTEAQPNKMFEYMSCGTPVIASDFPVWKDIIETNKCGLCVNPTDAASIAEGINFMIKNPQVAKEMGNNGQENVKEKYNWAFESKKLNKLYSGLIS